MAKFAGWAKAPAFLIEGRKFSENKTGWLGTQC
jgi:hypothetical protein